jgi:transcriptional regulator of acetoin/glycerol metabolism
VASASAHVRLSAADRALWERFVAGGFSPQEIESHPLLARWARSRRSGASPVGPAVPVGVTGGHVEDAARRLEPLLAWSGYDAFSQAVADAGFCAIVADAHGVVVRRHAARTCEPTLRSTRLVEGAQWSEDARGTNAIGTALAERAPVTVHGAAHFELANHALVCYAAPVRDARGEIVGVLDATGPVELAFALSQAAVVAAAATLEGVITLRAYDETWPGGLFALERHLGGLRHGAILVEKSGRVRLRNTGAAQFTSPKDPWSLVTASRAHGRYEVEPIGGDSPFAAIVHLRDKPRPRSEPPPLPAAFAGIVGSDPLVAEARRRAATFARSDLPVLLLAETGTGKELFARAIHASSPRASRPLVAINCGALSGSLLESELFGYAPGAFTGARTGGASGKLAAAHGGTLFLDEVAEMPPPVQAALLRFLEDGSYFRVGESTPRAADVRVVAATCRDLPAMVEDGRFRKDLYYRIRGATIRLPALRERRDLRELTEALLARIAERRGRGPAPSLSRAALASIESQPWPGNVRELRAALEHALVLAEGADVIELAHLPEREVAPRATGREADLGPGALRRASEREALLEALERGGGNLSEASRVLGVARTTLYRMMQRHGLRAP